jgi:TonB family protein
MKQPRDCCLALMLAASSCGSVAQQLVLPQVGASARAKPTLEDIDNAIENLRKSHWMLPEMMGNPPADTSGRSLQDDMAQYVLADAALAKITTLRNELAKQAAAGASVSLDYGDPLPMLVQSQICRMMMVSSYWSARRAREFHQEIIGQLIARLPEAERADVAREMAAIEARGGGARATMVEGMGSCDSLEPYAVLPGKPGAPGLFGDGNAEVEGYNNLRKQLATRLDAARLAAAANQGRILRSIPCPPPASVAGIEGSRGPKVRSQPDLRDYFPAEAINFKVTGAAKVRMSYDKTGCIADVSVLESTGAEILDAAAVRIAFDYALVPGLVDGKPVDGGVVLPVNFNVHDVMPEPPPGQPQP